MTFTRHEKKYICSPSMITVLDSRLKSLLRTDPNADTTGVYTVCSLYFDNRRDISKTLNEAGVDKRAKYRIRYYNGGEGLKLEKKEKNNGLSSKTSVAINLDQAQRLMRGDVSKLLHSTDPLLRELSVKIATENYSPKVIVIYDRKPYTAPTSNIRVTLDTNICCSYQTDRFLEGDFVKVPLKTTGMHLMEVKYDYILPSYITGALSYRDLNQCTFSKYYLSRQKAAQIRR